MLAMAWRNIWRNKARSIVIMLSVSVGLCAGLGVLALYKGMMKSRIRTVIESEVSHIQLHHPEFGKDLHPYYVVPGGYVLPGDLRRLPAVKMVAARQITQGMLVTTTGSAGVQINGVQPEAEYAITSLKQKFVEGNGFTDVKKNEVIIGKKLADKLKLKLNTRLVLTFTDSTNNLVSAAFRVKGIYRSSNTPLEELNVYVPITALGELLLTGNNYHELAILLQDDEDLDAVQEQIKKQYPDLLVESWKELSPETDLMVKTVDEYSYIILVIILIALAFGILNTMLMSVLERTKEIGMMVALGTSRLRIFLLILLETFFLTAAGTPIGMVAAYLVTGYYEKNGLDLSGMGKEMLASFGYESIIYPMFPWDKLVIMLIMVAGTAIISCLLPAIRALRLQPVETLRR